jgi:hypothetical protein
MKTTEQILREVGQGIISKSVATEAMQDYADQELREFKINLHLLIENEMEKEKKAAQMPGSNVHPTMYYNALGRVIELIDTL